MQIPLMIRQRSIYLVLLMLAYTLLSVMFARPGYAQTDVQEIKSEQVFIIPKNNELRILDSFQFASQPSLYTEPLTLRLPTGHENVQVISKNSTGYTLSDDGLVWKHGLPKGVQTVSVSYALKYENDQADIDFEQMNLIDSLYVLIPEGQIVLMAQGLYPVTQVVDIAGTKFRRFVTFGTRIGEPWTVSIQGLPKIGGSSRSKFPVPSDLPVIGAGYKYTELKALVNVLVVAIVLLLGVIDIRKKRRVKTHKIVIGKETQQIQKGVHTSD